MNLTIYYHVYRNSKNLEKSLNCIINQKCKNFEFILVDDCAYPKSKEIIKNLKIDQFPNFKYINNSQNVGHSYSFNLGLNVAEGKFIYYMGSNINLNENFTKIINDLIDANKSVDILSFGKLFKSKEETIQFEKINEKMYSLLTQNLKNKIFNVQYLKQNDLHLNNSKYYPLIFEMEIFNSFKN